LKIIFTGNKKRKAVTDNLLVFLTETLALIFAAVMIFCSRMSMQFFEILDYLPESFLAFVSNSRLQIFKIAALWAVSYCAFRTASANAPSRRSALCGSICTIIFYLLTSMAFNIIINQTHYYFLYGIFGNLIILLLNVYFFFVFFFFGAQLAFVIDKFNSLLFIQFRQIREAEKHSSWYSGLKEKLFGPLDGELEKYLQKYAKGEIIFAKGDGRKEIYYLLEGEVEVLISAAGNTGSMVASQLKSSFFGEMGYLLSEDRSATVRAETPVSVLALPPALFDDVLAYDPGLDRIILEQLSQRLKQSNEKLSEILPDRLKFSVNSD
jgi:membrane protein